MDDGPVTEREGEDKPQTFSIIIISENIENVA